MRPIFHRFSARLLLVLPPLFALAAACGDKPGKFHGRDESGGQGGQAGFNTEAPQAGVAPDGSAGVPGVVVDPEGGATNSDAGAGGVSGEAGALTAPSGGEGGAATLGACEGPLLVPDSALQAAIRSATGVATEPILPAAFNSLTTLSASGVTTLDGIECLRSLTALAITNGTVVDLSRLTSLDKLTSLDVSFNQVVDISPLASLTALQTLALDGNTLQTTAPLAGLSKLTNLGLSDCGPINLTPLSSLSALTNLRAESDALVDVTPLSGLSHLYELDLYGNQLTDPSPLSGLNELFDLDLSFNKIADPSPLTGLAALRYLKLRGNPITAGALTNLPNLQSVEFSSTSTTVLPDLSGLPNLYSLDFEGTLITDFTGLTSLNLRELYASRSALTKLNLVGNAPSLRVLHIGGGTVHIGSTFYQLNDLSPIATFTNLEELWVDALANPLPYVSGLQHLRAVVLRTYFNLDLTQLANLPELSYVELSVDSVSLAPLVANAAFASTDALSLTNSDISKPFDCSSVAADLATLKARGVSISGSCQ